MSASRLSQPVRWGALAAALLGIGAAVGYWLPHGLPDAESPAGSGDRARTVLYWHDPMVPNSRFDRPGKSPYMDMQLVPVYADEAAGGAGSVRVAGTVGQALGIRLGKVEKATLAPSITTTGSVAFDDRLLELVQARVDGYVTRLHVKAPFEHVRLGQALAEIQAPMWLEAGQEYLALLDATSTRGLALRAAVRERLRILGMPEAAIRQIESQRKVNASTQVVAPISGVVSELGVREGAAFPAGALLFRINGLAKVWVNAQIAESQVSLVPQDATVLVRAMAWPGREFKGRVVGLLPDVDVQTRTLTARLQIDNADGALAPGMFVSVSLSTKKAAPQLVVPSEAVIMTGERSVVVRAGPDGSFEVVNVSVGPEQGDRTAIFSGLSEGDSVVVSGQFLIDSEASLKSTIGRLGGKVSSGDAGTGESRP
nr:A4 [uncultured bacterium]